MSLVTVGYDGVSLQAGSIRRTFVFYISVEILLQACQLDDGVYLLVCQTLT